MSDYPSRVQRMYEQYAPEKQGNVPTILAKFQGKEDELLATLVTKYGPEPKAAAPSATSPAKQGAKAPSGKKAPAGGGAAPQPASSPKRMEGDTGSAAATSEDQPSTLAPVQRQGGDNNGFNNTGPNPLLDPLYSLRNQVRTQIGFLTKEHELMWEDAWMGKMPLGTLRKTWDVKQSVLMAGQGWKMSSHARPVKRWQKRYFVLAPPFLYYFSNDSPSCICKGALYLDRATIEEDIVKEKNAIIITSRVTKKPPVLNQGFLAKFGQSKSSGAGEGGGGGGGGGNGEGAGDMNSFTINFDQEREQATWLDLMKKVVKLGDVGLAGKTYGDYPANPMHMMMQQMMAGGGGANGGRGGGMDPNAMASNPMFAQMMQQQHMQQQMMGGGGAASSSSRNPQQQGTTSNNNNPYSWMMGFNNYNVDAPEIKRRIVRLARDRDPILMADVFLQFIQDHMENAPILWKLMASLEEIEPYTGPTFQMNGMMGGPYGGAGGMMGGGGGQFGQYPGGVGVGGNTALANMPYMRQQQYPNQMMQQQQQSNASGMNSSFGGGGHLQQQHQEAGGLAPSSAGNPAPVSSPEELDRVSLASLHEQFNQSGGQSALMRASGRGYARDATPEEMEWSVGQRSHQNQEQQYQQQQPHSSMSHQSSSFGGGGGEDAEWQQRISRIRDRKHLVDRLVQDLPE